MMFLDWYRQKLARRLAGPSLLLSVLAVCLISVMTYYVAREIFKEKTVSRLKVAVDLREAAMKNWVADQKKSVVFISRTSIVRERIAELLTYDQSHIYHSEAFRKVSEYLFAYIKNFDGLREIMILSDRGGRVLFSTDTENEGEYRAGDTFFRKGSEALFVQGVYPWRETAEPTITISKPLLDANGVKSGVLAVHLNLERLDEIIRGDFAEADSVETYLVDKYNTFISADSFGRQDFPRGVHSEGIDRAVEGTEGFGFYLNYIGVPVVGYYRWSPELEVAIISEITQEEAFAPARQLGLFIAGIGLVLNFVLIFALVIASKRVAWPILTMSKIAADIADGNFSMRVPVMSQDETGDLARAFNSMIAQINIVHDELQESATYFRSVFQLSPDAIGVQRAGSGVFVNVNERFCDVFGYTQEEACGLSADKLQLWQSQRDRLRLVAQLHRKKQIVNFSANFRRRSGEIFPGVISSRMIELEDDYYIVSVLLDVSKLHQAELGLQQSRERLQLLIDRMPIGCITWNIDFTVGLWNPEAERIFGYAAHEVTGRHAFDLILPEELQSQIGLVWDKLMAGDETAHSENANITRNGSRIICDWYNTPLKNENGEVIGVISMVRDITDKKRTEEEARLKTELLQAVMNAIPAPIFFKDRAGVYQECNAAFTEFLGLEYSQIIGHTVYEVAPEDKAKIYTEADRMLLEQGGMQSYESRIRYADGSDRDVVFHKAVFSSPGGGVAGLVGVILDVSAIKSAQSALVESEQNYREIFNASSEAIIVRDADNGKVVDVNQAMLEMFGYSYKEALQTTIADLSEGIPPYAQKQALVNIRKAMAGEPQLVEWRAKRKDGTLFWVEIALKRSTILGEDRVLAVIRDIEERRATEQARRESEERFQLLIENAADSMFMHAENGQIMNVNQRACDSLGYSRAELLGMMVDQLESGMSSEELQRIWQEMEVGKSISLDGEQVKKNGERLPVEVNLVKFDSQGATLFLAVARDITERRATEAELSRYRGQLEELVRERTRQLEAAQDELVAKERLAVLGQLTATVSHELRNPLGTVKNAIYLLGRVRNEGDLRGFDKALELADRNVKRCDDIINELLDYTRRQEFSEKKIDLGEWLQEILNEQTLPDDLEVSVSLPSGVVVYGDPERLRRAFVNVLLNAVQAFSGQESPEKQLEVGLGTTDEQIQITVKDTGAGIPDDVMARIFEPMFSTKNFGVGLGMSIVKNIMEEHGGGISLESQPGEGTSVLLWLPRRQKGATKH